MILVKIVADSINSSGNRLTTFELEYPRYIHAELLTHKMLSKNSQSSRAVPVSKLTEANKSAVEPLVWGKNQAGMQSSQELTGWRLFFCKLIWKLSSTNAFVCSRLLAKLGLHKQWSNRITEPFSKIKVVVSGTEWANFFWLRTDNAAQPEMLKLALDMQFAMNESTPDILKIGEWHIPYVEWQRINDKQIFFDDKEQEISQQDALKISASCCAQVSYRKLDNTKEKAIQIYDKLFSSNKPHYSPTEHQGKVMKDFQEKCNVFEGGVSHIDGKNLLWSSNFKGFVQFRKLLESEEINANSQHTT